VLRGYETYFLLVANVFFAKGNLSAFQDHLRFNLVDERHPYGLRTKVTEFEGKVVCSMQGNAMRDALSLGGRIVDPTCCNVEYTADDYLHPEWVELLAEGFEAWKRLDVALRGIFFGDESGSMEGSFTHALQTCALNRAVSPASGPPRLSLLPPKA